MAGVAPMTGGRLLLSEAPSRTVYGKNVKIQKRKK